MGLGLGFKVWGEAGGHKECRMVVTERARGFGAHWGL